MHVTLEDITYSYRNSAEESLALGPLSLHIDCGTHIALLGATGSGKSTLLLLLAGLLKPDTGRILYNGEPARTRADMRRVRQQVALGLQRPEEQFFAASVWDEAQFALRNLGRPHAEPRTQAALALHAFGIDPQQYGNRSPFTLSGGEQRRVALASVLVTNPSLALLDEPLAGLDPQSAANVWNALRRCIDELGATCVIATHDPEWAVSWADTIVVLSAGQMLFSGRVTSLGEFDWHGAGLPKPELVELADMLRTRGMRMPVGVEITPDALADAILADLRTEQP